MLSQELWLIQMATDVSQVTQVMNELFGVKSVWQWALLVT